MWGLTRQDLLNIFIGLLMCGSILLMDSFLIVAVLALVITTTAYIRDIT